MALLLLLVTTALANSHPFVSVDKVEPVYPENECAHGHTFCSSKGCCPTSNAVCCSNMKHCCPEGYTCDVQREVCTRKSYTLHLNYSTSQTKFFPLVVKCNDKEGSVCPDNYRCCLYQKFVGHGCCEGTKSICCADREHCCPQGTTCDVPNGNCVKRAFELYAPNNVSSIVCPDGSTTCADKDTCCKLLVKDAYGCCPQPQAVCCSDGTTCCPNGYSCGSDKCNHKIHGILAKQPLKQQPPPPLKLKTVCDDGTVCGANDTCCIMNDTSWGCCPSPNAVCCSDGSHCCPQQYTCNTEDFTCVPPTNYQSHPKGFKCGNNGKCSAVRFN